jgi:hypothetical protein
MKLKIIFAISLALIVGLAFGALQKVEALFSPVEVGYFTGQTPGASYFTGTGLNAVFDNCGSPIINQSMAYSGGSATSEAQAKANFIAAIDAYYSNGYINSSCSGSAAILNNKAGARFVIQTINQYQGPNAPAVTTPKDILDYKARINSPNVSMVWTASLSYSYNSGWGPKTTSGFKGVADDYMFSEGSSAGIPGLDMWVTNNGIRHLAYQIKATCGNVVGDNPGLPLPNWTLKGTSSVDKATHAIGETVTFSHTVKNIGPAASTAFKVNLEFVAYQGSGSSTPPACGLIPPTTPLPCSAKNSTVSALNPGATSPPLTSSFAIPSTAKSGDKYCQLIHISPSTETAGSSTYSAEACVTVVSSTILGWALIGSSTVTDNTQGITAQSITTAHSGDGITFNHTIKNTGTANSKPVAYKLEFVTSGATSASSSTACPTNPPPTSGSSGLPCQAGPAGYRQTLPIGPLTPFLQPFTFMIPFSAKDGDEYCQLIYFTPSSSVLNSPPGYSTASCVTVSNTPTPPPLPSTPSTCLVSMNISQQAYNQPGDPITLNFTAPTPPPPTTDTNKTTTTVSYIASSSPQSNYTHTGPSPNPPPANGITTETTSWTTSGQIASYQHSVWLDKYKVAISYIVNSSQGIYQQGTLNAYGQAVKIVDVQNPLQSFSYTTTITTTTTYVTNNITTTTPDTITYQTISTPAIPAVPGYWLRYYHVLEWIPGTAAVPAGTQIITVITPGVTTTSTYQTSSSTTSTTYSPYPPPTVTGIPVDPQNITPTASVSFIPTATDNYKPITWNSISTPRYFGPDSCSTDIVGPSGGFPVATLPTFKVTGSSARIGGEFRSASNSSCANTGSWGGVLGGWYNTASQSGSGAELAAIALIRITGFASAQTLPPPSTRPPDRLTFANDVASGGGSFTPTFGQGFGGTAYCLTEFNTPTTAKAFNPSNVSGGSYYSPSDLDLSGLSISSPVRLFVNGNVRISGNITYVRGAWSAGNVPSFVVQATGNIYIDPSVTSLDGLYIARTDATAKRNKGNIYTCAGPGYSTMDLTQLNDGCNNQLVVHGSFVADTINLWRTYGTLKDGSNNCSNAGTSGSFAVASHSSCAAEIFEFSPELYLAPDPRNNSGSDSWDSVTSLPPVL